MASVTMKDLARDLGVSVTTISNAYSHPDRLSADLRQRILSRGDELGYTGPDAVGRLLRSGRANAVGALCGGGYSSAFTDEYTLTMFAALSRELEANGVTLSLLPTGIEEDNVDAVANAVVDGLVSMSARTESEAVKFARRRGLRIVFGHMNPDAEFVAPDDRAGGQMLGELVATKGHKVVALLQNRGSGDWPVVVPDMASFAPEDTSWHWARTRAEGIREALGPGATIHYVQVPYGQVHSDETVEFLMGLEPRPTAWMAMSDRIALALCQAAESRGLVVGDDISITGYDGTKAALAAGLTTVVQPIEEKGLRTAKLLLDPDATERQIVLPVELVEGRTVGAPKL